MQKAKAGRKYTVEPYFTFVVGIPRLMLPNAFQCDGKRPGCSQCTFSGLECGGYPVDWRFVAQGQEPNPEVSPGAQHDRPPCQIQAKAQSSRYSQEPKTSDNTLLSQTCLYRPDAITLADVIVKEFVPKSERSILPYDSDHVEPRICGSWVEVLSDLPSLRIGNSVLSRAITALGVSILSRPNNVNIECTRTYETAIHMLRQSLSVDESALKFDLLPAVMCLTMVEVHITPLHLERNSSFGHILT